MVPALPPLQVVDNKLPRSHPGAVHAPGTVLAPRDVEQEAETELATLYAPLTPPDPALPHVRANFITTLDGSVIGSDGKSGSINGPGDLRVFQLLRAQADAVFVGAGTARIEGYEDTDLPAGLRQMRTTGQPRLITVTRSGDLSPEFLQADPLVITAESHPAARKLARVMNPENLLIFGTEAVDFPAALRRLRELGYAEILCEGGPHLMGALLENHLVAEMCLSFSPLIVGGAGPRFVVGTLAPTTARLQTLLAAPDGYLMSRWLLQPSSAAA